jgi:hypothetical protein
MPRLSSLVSALVFWGALLFGSTAAMAGPPIFAQDGPPANAGGVPGQVLLVSVKYKLTVPGSDPIHFGREPLDVIFTAPPNTFTFLPQYTVAVVSNSISLATNCKTNASNTELQCKIDPQANGVVNVKGDIEFRPLVQISPKSTAGSIFLGGSVIYYQDPSLLPPNAPPSVPIPVLTGSVNYYVTVK